MFYSKEISVYNLKRVTDDHHFTVNKYVKEDKAYLCDVQPYSAEKLKKEYGYDIDVNKRIFIDIYNEIKESSIIKYKDSFYDIKKIIEWDDYLEIMIIESKNNIVVE